MIKRRITSSYFNRLHKNMKALMIQTSNRYTSSVASFDDNMIIALEQLLYTMIHYQPQRGTVFTTYFVHRMWGCMRHNRQRQMKCICPSNSETAMMLLSETKSEIDLPMLVDELLSCLDPYQRQIIESYFLDNHTLREIEANTHTSYTTVQTNREKALERIRARFPKEGRHA